MSTQPTVAAQQTKPIAAILDPITPAEAAKLYKKHGLEGWRIKSDVGFGSGPKTFEPLPFLKGDEQYVPGPTMLERGKELGPALGLLDLIRIVEKENEKPGTVIPEEYRNQRYFPADGTVLLAEDGSECLACASWDGDGQRWFVFVIGLEYDWDSFGRLLRPASK